MGALGGFVLGLVVGVALGAVVVWGLWRALGRTTGSDARGLGRLVVSGLQPGGRADGVAAQRALARRLQRTGGKAASGRRVAASDVELHVSPEDFALIDEALGIERAADDLVAFYREHASRSGWLQQGGPRIALVRDISLRPRQSYARASTVADGTGREQDERPEPVPAPARPADRPHVVARSRATEPPRTAPPADEAVTDVLPRGLLHDRAEVDDAFSTRAYPIEDAVDPGDLVVVHGTDVRTITAAQGTVSVGRAGHNDIVIDRPSIARDHLLVERRDDAWWIVPGSAPGGGTRLDGHVLDRPAPIDGQALLELGRGVRMRLSVEPARRDA